MEKTNIPCLCIYYCVGVESLATAYVFEDAHVSLLDTSLFLLPWPGSHRQTAGSNVIEPISSCKLMLLRDCQFFLIISTIDKYT